jgi:hydroxymethylglutaryl-CoA lyase
MTYPAQVTVTEVGMRDGFQMEARVLPTDTKVRIGLALIAAGVTRLEATSFVSPAAVPQLADAADLIARLKGHGAVLSALVPNVNGARRAAAAGVDRMTVFVSASETHNVKNVRRSVADSLAALGDISAIAAAAAIPLTAGVATSFGCPFEGDVSTDAVLRVVDAYLRVGVEEISLGDTTGMATPRNVESLLRTLRDHHPRTPFALHFHNTRGLGLVNVMTGLELGIDRFESSIGGLGGCPFAVGATGNVCSEDLIYLLDELGITSGIDLQKLIAVADAVQDEFARELPGQLMKSGPRLSVSTEQPSNLTRGQRGTVE